MTILILPASVLLALAFSFIKIRRYRKTEYFRQNFTPYNEVMSDRGKCGEYQIYRKLSPLNGYKRWLFNCFIPKDNGERTEIDVILLHETGIYVFESKNYSGWVFGTENNRCWNQVFRENDESKRYRFFNPIFQNEGHCRWLKNMLENKLPMYSFVVFGDACNINGLKLQRQKKKVCNLRNLPQVLCDITKNADQILTPPEIDQIYERLYPFTQLSKAEKEKHKEKVQEKQQKNDAEWYCPLCGNPLVLRTAKKGKWAGKQFWGCSNYPECHFLLDASGASENAGG